MDIRIWVHVRGYVVKVKRSVLHYFWGPDIFAKTKCYCRNNQVKHVNIPMSLTNFE